MAKGFIGNAGYKAYLGGVKLKAGYIGAQQVYSSSVKITFVEGNTRTVIEYDEGSTVSRGSTPPSGSTFLGWSASPSGVNPVKTFIASEDATYYRVVKYNDYVINSVSYVSNKSSGELGPFGPYYIDPNKYTLTLYVYSHGPYASTLVMNAKAEYEDGNDYAYISAQNDGSARKANVVPMNPTYIEYHRTSGYWVSGSVTAVGKTIVG